MKIILISFLIFFIALTISAQDKFADIGTRKYDVRASLLTEPQPPVLPDINLPLTHNPRSVFKVVKPISTKEELAAELVKMRNRYEPFMQNLAPAPAETRKKIPLTEFNWRIETSADPADFAATLRGEGNWEKVKIPHYGPPLGRAVTYYFKEIELGK
ncbi:MAG TPA: hypothetical protein VN249_00150, partial [Prolixibacteraceae bacterium]|nr:hypothetical protein [Prolixibacteraceae bacterium]